MSGDGEAIAKRGKSMTQDEVNKRYAPLRKAATLVTDNSKIEEGIAYYYKVHEEGMEVPKFPNNFNKKKLLLELAGETMNRDYLQYIMTGTWGTTTSELLRIIS